MMMIRLIAGLCLALGLSACGDAGLATRNAPLPTLGMGVDAPQAVTRNYRVTGMAFQAPSTIKISEGGGYYPFSDVVWRGDPKGDRIAQIAAIFQTAVDRGTADMTGARPVTLDIGLLRFHGVTERTRFSVGGVYNVVFMLTVRDAASGAVIEPARKIVANLSAPGGTAAIMAEQAGQTEKVRVTDYLTYVLRDELTGTVQTAAL